MVEFSVPEWYKRMSRTTTHPVNSFRVLLHVFAYLGVSNLSLQISRSHGCPRTPLAADPLRLDPCFVHTRRSHEARTGTATGSECTEAAGLTLNCSSSSASTVSAHVARCPPSLVAAHPFAGGRPTAGCGLHFKESSVSTTKVIQHSRHCRVHPTTPHSFLALRQNRWSCTNLGVGWNGITSSHRPVV